MNIGGAARSAAAAPAKTGQEKSSCDVFLDDLCREKSQPYRCPSLASLLAVMDRIPALLWATDLESRFTSLTGRGLRAAGVCASDYVGKPVAALFQCPGLNQGVQRSHANALQGQGCSFEMEVNGRDLEAHLEPLRAPGPDGAVVGVVGVALDLTERMVAERALRLSEHSYRSLIEEAPYAICRSTGSGQLLQVNRAMLEMLGYDPASEAELLIRDLPLIFAPGTYNPLREVLLGEGVLQGIESTWLRRDGEEIQVRVSGRAVRDQAGEVSHLDVLAEDITEKKRLEAQLSQAQKMQVVGQLAGGVAHDFNNLLTVIGGNVEILMRQAGDYALHERLTEVKQAADRAAALTQQLLAFSRRQILQSKVVNLNQVIGHQLAMLRRLIREDVELTFQPAEDLGWVLADPHQIERVLMNLALNAQDAMQSGGRLAIETTNVRIDVQPGRRPEEAEPGNYVRIMVRDSGQGMDREVQAHIFEPFFTTKEAGEGTGLGLSMVYGIVKQSGGHIRLESAPGQGSTFAIYLPQVAPPAPVWQAPVHGGLVPRGWETILLAEDEDSLRRLLAEYLGDLGYRVLTASDGMAAMAVARSYPGPIHLLLSDLVMPKMGGRELGAELNKSVPDLKIIFMSGYAGSGVAARDLELPEAYFLPKPLSMAVLAKTVREVLDSQ